MRRLASLALPAGALAVLLAAAPALAEYDWADEYNAQVEIKNAQVEIIRAEHDKMMAAPTTAEGCEHLAKIVYHIQIAQEALAEMVDIPYRHGDGGGITTDQATRDKEDMDAKFKKYAGTYYQICEKD